MHSRLMSAYLGTAQFTSQHFYELFLSLNIHLRVIMDFEDTPYFKVLCEEINNLK
jgi:hypothetical protein